MAGVCHPRRMKDGTRSVVAVLLGFVAYRITTEFIQFWTALIIGVAVAAATWLLTAPRGGRRTE